MNPIQTCPNCPGAATEPVFAIRRGNHVVRCTRCGLQFAEVYPDIRTADAEVYTGDYFKPAIGKLKEREAVFNELLTEIESLLERRGRLLDVGAGEGTLLRVASDRGWQAEGTEISSAMVEHVRATVGATVHAGVLEEIALEPRSFDVIIMNHVLEHVKNPRTTLEKVAQLLRPEGVARIEVPNIASLSSRDKNIQSRLRIKPNPWKHYDTGHHFWFFTPGTLRATIEGAGLSVVSLRAPGNQWGRKGFW